MRSPALLAFLAVSLAGSTGLSLRAAARSAGAEGGSFLLIVAGIGGSPEHRDRFAGLGRTLCEAATRSPRRVRVLLLVERVGGEDAPDDPCAPGGRSTLDEIGTGINSAAEAREELLVVLIGHGVGGETPRFHLPGPDLSPAALDRMLDRASGAVTVAHLGSASGAFLPELSAPGRVLLAAAGAHETNETRFAEHFVAAFGPEGDRNRDGEISALEAFDFARVGVERAYEGEGLLRTEHPLLDDNGDGVGSLEPEPASGADGMLAARRSLLYLTGARASAAEDPALAALIAERDALAARVDALREIRENMDEAAYLSELEEYLVQIAEIAERIRRLREESG